MGIKTLIDFYQSVEREVCLLSSIHSARLRCRYGCRDCCIDELTVFEIEAENIQSCYPDLLRQANPHPVGACAFLDEAGACRIYEHRPYVCRTQGLPLRWIEEPSEERIVEKRDICLLNDRGNPVETLPADECWSIGPFEEELARLQAAVHHGKLHRKSLRELFNRTEAKGER
ncbi:YkgJ family cysteine cluster protein [bacterium]|nr:MAG: YkgJ family cysteine cluster protein [bacterium]